MAGASSSADAMSPSFSPYAPFSVVVYLQEFCGCLDAQRFRAMPCDGYRRTVYDAGNRVDRDTRVGAWIRRWAHWGGSGASLRRDDVSWPNMQFVRCREERAYSVRLAKIVASYMSVRSSELPEHCLGYVAFQRPFDNLHVFGNFQYWMKETVFERCQRSCGENKCFVNWHCVDVYAIPPHVCAQFFIRVPEWWSKYECTHLLFVPTPWVFAYYSNLVLDMRADRLTMRIALSEFCVCVLTSFWLSALVGGPSGCGDLFAGVDELAARGILLPMLTGVREFVESLGFFRILSECTFNPVKAYLAYHRSLEVMWDQEDCVGWFPYDASSGKVINMPKRRLASNKRAADGSFIFKNVRKIPVSYGSSTLMTLDEVRGAARVAGVVVEDPPAEVMDPIDDEDQVEKPWNLNDLSIPSCGGSVMQQLQALCEKSGLPVPKTAANVKELFVTGVSAITENTVLKAALNSRSDASASLREHMAAELKVLRTQKAARVNSDAAATTAVARCRLLENSRDEANRDVFYAAQAVETLHSLLQHRRVEAHRLKERNAAQRLALQAAEKQVAVSTQLALDRHKEVQQSNTTVYHGARVVAALYQLVARLRTEAEANKSKVEDAESIVGVQRVEYDKRAQVMTEKYSTLQKEITVLRADYDQYAGRAAKDLEAVRRELQERQSELAAAKELSIAWLVENRSPKSRLDGAVIELNTSKRERDDALFDRDSAVAKAEIAVAREKKLSAQMAAGQNHLKTVRQSLPNVSKRLAGDVDKGFVAFCRQLLESARDAVVAHREGAEKSANIAMEPSTQVLQTLEAELGRKMLDGN